MRIMKLSRALQIFQFQQSKFKMNNKTRINCRKGMMAFNFIAMIPRIIFLVIALISCVVMISMFLNQRFHTHDVQADILITGMLYGSGGITYYDPVTGRNYPYIVHLNQFNESEIDHFFSFPEENNIITAEISLRKSNGALVRKIYYNKKWWFNWKPLLDSRIKGIGGIKQYEKSIPIIFIDEKGVSRMGKLEFNVLQPKG